MGSKEILSWFQIKYIKSEYIYKMKYEALQSDRYYHIFNQGNNKENIFFESRNFDYFLLLLEKHIVPIADIYAYCLLSNHFEPLLSRAFSNFFNAYSKAVNKSYNRSGSLFQDRFKRIIIEDEEYFKTLILYIHLNPTNHKFTEDYRSYNYSSYSTLISDEPTFLQREEILNLFGDVENFEEVHLRRQEEIGEMDNELFLE